MVSAAVPNSAEPAGCHAPSRRPPGSRAARRRAARIATTAVVAIGLLGGGVLAGPAAGDAGQAATVPTAGDAGAPLPASLTFTGGSQRIPQSFFGLSIEYKELYTYESAGSAFERAISLVRPRDGEPMLLRIGGKSADHVWWQSAKESPPQWVTKIGYPWLTALSELVRRDDLHVMLDLNLAVHSATMAGNFAVAAIKTLPQASLVGLEVGNEPDLYWRQPSLEKQRIRSTARGVPLHWTTNYSAPGYRRDFTDYARGLATRVPGIPLGADEIISSKPDWLAAVTGLGRLAPGFIAIHRYASSTCWPSTSPYYPTIPLILRENASAGLARTVQNAVSLAHANHMALRLTEVNSVSCGGNHGVTDSFASALWTPDTLFEMIRAGVDGVNWHIRPATVNAPFHFAGHGIVALPELYGLAVFAQMTHGPASLLNTSLSGSSALHVKAWAVRKGGAGTVLLINKGASDADVTLPAGSGAGATVRMLTAPKIGSTGGVRFGGQWIGSDARWHGRQVATAVTARGGVYRVLVPAYSAAAISLHL